ncbi:unnamed protein product [Paramecium pentaurelia]|uniref:Uncharacterized protein n=1 Tax=Paramecium pentaurelia TaxID=43138 RepID=A0A8S1X9J1_9CILI|nr:unnamed protein product [Paramecium pentaurelia]
MISLSVYGMSKQDNKKPNQMVIVTLLYQSVSLLMEIHQLLIVQITLSVYGMSKTEIQVKNARYPFFNTPLQYIQYYGLPRLQFFKVQESFLQKTVSFQENNWSNT